MARMKIKVTDPMTNVNKGIILRCKGWLVQNCSIVGAVVDFLQLVVNDKAGAVVYYSLQLIVNDKRFCVSAEEGKTRNNDDDNSIGSAVE